MSNHWMPIYIGDYHRETRHLTAEQHGGYLLLLMEYWTRGALPDDDAQLARMAGMTGAQWRRNRSVLQELFVDGWKHPQLDTEMERAAEISAKYTARGKKGAEARHKKVETEKAQSFQDGRDASSNPQAGLKHHNSQSQSQSYKKEREDAPSAPPSQDNSSRKTPSKPQRMRMDWTPPEAVIDAGVALGLKRGYITDIAKAKFKRHHLDKRTLSTDFDDMFLIWLREDAAKHGCEPVDPTKPKPASKFIAEGSNQWKAWDEYFKAQGKRMPLPRPYSLGNGCFLETELPPKPAMAEAA